MVQTFNTTQPQTMQEKLEQDRKDIQELADAMGKHQEPNPITKISTHIHNVWVKNQQDNKAPRQDMIKQLRRTRGEYDPVKLANIKAFKGSEMYIRNSESKCRAAESWIKDIYRAENDLPWILEPTTISDIPQDQRDKIQNEILMKGQELAMTLQQQAMNTGQPFDPASVAKIMQEWQEEAEEQLAIEIEKDAKERCKLAEKKIRDQNQECKWDDAFKDFLWYFIRTKAGIVKGPILTKKYKQKWQYGVQGQYEFVSTEVLVPDVYAVSPFMFYPTRNMSKVQDGDVIELHKLSYKALSDLIGVPGYDEIQIRAVLNKYKSGALKAKWLTIDDEVQVKQVEKEKTSLATTPVTNLTTSTLEDELYAIEFYGTVTGDMLIEWGLAGNLDANKTYQVNCWKIGDHVIKAVLNPDNLGRKPYHVTSWAKSPHWIWGESLHDMAEPVEDMLNSIARALQNNVGIASGPQVEINSDRCDDKTPLYPWKRWYSTSLQMKEGPAINFFQPQMHVQELITAYVHFSKVLDEMTVPAYAQGASQSGVTAGTATVFTQLLANATRSIKNVVANIDDDVITPYIQMCYDYLMEFDSDQKIKGDARVVAKGVAGLMAKEQEAQRKVEFLQVTANPVFSQILGSKNIGAILAQIAKGNNINLPDMERLEGNPTLEDLVTQMLQSQAGTISASDPNQATGQIGAGGTPTQPQAMLPNGAEQGVVNG